MAFPETSNERIEFSKFNKTKGELNELKKMVEAKTQVGDTMDKLINTGLEELRVELREANIPENEMEAYLEEYKARVSEKIAKINEDKVIETPEAIALETFMSDINNFPKLKAINDALGASNLKGRYGETIAKFDEILSTVAGFFGWNIGEPHLRAKFYEGVEWLAKKAGINLGGELNEKHPNNPEIFNNKDVSELLRLASKTGSEGESVKNFISGRFAKEKFGDLKKITETSLTFHSNNQEIVYELRRNAMGNPIVVLADKEQVYDGKLEGLVGAMSKINSTDHRVS